MSKNTTRLMSAVTLAISFLAGCASDQVGRYQIAGAGGYLFRIDTTTGKVERLGSGQGLIDVGKAD